MIKIQTNNDHIQSGISQTYAKLLPINIHTNNIDLLLSIIIKNTKIKGKKFTSDDDILAIFIANSNFSMPDSEPLLLRSNQSRRNMLPLQESLVHF
ncbi:hypothetical protein E2986_13865 [Frieseomelitta varia]|uniref:Uncharacterized protein n=1 Tax=Frieseomelitta varia TaxID=561572 RepID=A0A833W0G1_9HYME|nr:hypothetical protein E2986_13865 [Frieseomelitta varia]